MEWKSVDLPGSWKGPVGKPTELENVLATPPASTHYPLIKYDMSCG
jgi:hypothetical protein